MTQVVEEQKNESKQLSYHTDFNYGIITRDGIRLATIIHRPTDNIPRETMVIRNPYNAIGFYGVAKMFAENLPIKLNYVIQDVRGRYNSEGNFEDSVFNENNDTLDTLDFIAEQPWSDGVVHFFGPSYLGWVGLQALQVRDQTKATIKSVFAPMTFNSLVDNAIFNEGILNLHHGYPWCIMMSGRVQGPLNYINIPFPECYDTAMEVGIAPQGYPTTMWDIFTDYDRIKNMTIRYDKDPAFKVKTTLVASYFDSITRGTLNAFEEVMNIGGVKPNLIIGPWGHNQYTTSLDSIGAIKVNIDQGLKEDLVEHLMGLEHAIEYPDEFFVRIFVLRRDEWLTFNQWPLPTNSLDIVLPNSQTYIQAHYDNPVPTLGGPVWDNQLVKGLQPGAYDQREINRREDIVRLYTQSFEKNTTIMGNASVSLKARASIDRSHITAKLCIVQEDGSELILQNGIKMINTADNLEDHNIKLDFSAFEIKSGEKLMVEISWSNFSRYEKPRHQSDYTIELGENIILNLQQYNNWK